MILLVLTVTAACASEVDTNKQYNFLHLEPRPEAEEPRMRERSDRSRSEATAPAAISRPVRALTERAPLGAERSDSDIMILNSRPAGIRRSREVASITHEELAGCGS